MPTRKKVPDEKIVEALRRSNGRLPAAAKLLGISRQGLHQRLEKNPMLASSKFDRQKMELTLLVASTLRAALSTGAPWAVKFVWSEFGAEIGCSRNKERYDEARIEQLVIFLHGNLAKYRAERARLSANIHITGAKRRRIRERAAAIAIGLPKTTGIWPLFRFAEELLEEQKPGSKRKSS